jgi:hypothetical protein
LATNDDADFGFTFGIIFLALFLLATNDDADFCFTYGIVFLALRVLAANFSEKRFLLMILAPHQ